VEATGRRSLTLCDRAAAEGKHANARRASRQMSSSSARGRFLGLPSFWLRHVTRFGQHANVSSVVYCGADPPHGGSHRTGAFTDPELLSYIVCSSATVTDSSGNPTLRRSGSPAEFISRSKEGQATASATPSRPVCALGRHRRYKYHCIEADATGGPQGSRSARSLPRRTSPSPRPPPGRHLTICSGQRRGVSSGSARRT